MAITPFWKILPSAMRTPSAAATRAWSSLRFARRPRLDRVVGLALQIERWIAGVRVLTRAKPRSWCA